METEIENDKASTIAYCLEVKRTIENFLGKMNVLFEEVEVFKGLSNTGPKFIIRSTESGLLIGPRGEHLRALNHVIRKIVQKNSDLARFTVDINDYQEENIKRIRNQAIAITKKVKALGKKIEMDPMSSFERMIVHSLFAQDPEITTESVGEKNQRRVVIKLKN